MGATSFYLDQVGVDDDDNVDRATLEIILAIDSLMYQYPNTSERKEFATYVFGQERNGAVRSRDGVLQSGAWVNHWRVLRH